jgi:hypothetical protein
MVVVTLAGELESRALAGQIDRDEGAGFNQRFDGTIYRRDTESFLAHLGGSMNFLDRDRTIRLVQHVMNRAELSGLPNSHGHLAVPPHAGHQPGRRQN